MLECWDANPQTRPSFADMVVRLDSLLESVAEYLDISIVDKDTGLNAAGKGCKCVCVNWDVFLPLQLLKDQNLSLVISYQITNCDMTWCTIMYNK